MPTKLMPLFHIILKLSFGDSFQDFILPKLLSFSMFYYVQTNFENYTASN